jgi:predicted MFS family arabinose efflux permease
LFAVVYGFSHAETAGWLSPVTLGFLVAAVALLGLFAWLQTRAVQPLLPLRVILDRNRGGSFLAMFAAAAGMFGVFLFLTYYLESTKNFSTVLTGVSFLPMIAVLITVSTIVSTRLADKLSPKILIPAGMLCATVGMLWLTGLGVHSSYVSHVLPSTMVIGVGLGVVFTMGMSVATLGVEPDDAGVASATVNTVQQVGGSVGTALLNTLAATAAASFAAAHVGRSGLSQLAAVHSYVTAFWWSAAIFAVGALVTAVVLRPGIPDYDAGGERVPSAH